MLSESASDVKFEIGHVLFIDIVGYSKLLINEQSEQLETLRRSSAEPNSSGMRKQKGSWCGCRPAMAAH